MFHRLRDNFKNSYRIDSIFYMYIDMGERIAGKQDGPGPIIYRPPRAPRIAKHAKKIIILWPIYGYQYFRAGIPHHIVDIYTSRKN